MITPILQDVFIYRGDSKTFKVINKDGDGAVVDITGSSIIFSVKKNAKDVDYAFTQKKNTAAGGGDSQIEITDAANGEFQVFILSADTQDLEIDNYEYDAQLTTALGKTHTVVRGGFAVVADITRPS